MSQAARREPRAEQLSIGSYEPLFELGRGGMGTVFLARAIGAAGFERLVVVKRLNPHLLDQEQAVRRFLDEARIAARVHHANVIGTHHVGHDDDGLFLVLDYVEGGNLDELLERSLCNGILIPPPILLRIAVDALAGLHAVHTAQDAAGRPLNILHRDVSLQNVLVGRDGVARIADFGIAKSRLGSVTTDKAYVVGKLLYMPREYLCRETPGPTFDVYSLGITLWLALSGHDLWPDESEAQIIKRIVEDRVPDLSSVMSIPPQIAAIIAKATAADHRERYQNARAMSEDIEQLARETGWVATHAEVAQLVDSLLGADLRRRRELLAKHESIPDDAFAYQVWSDLQVKARSNQNSKPRAPPRSSPQAASPAAPEQESARGVSALSAEAPSSTQLELEPPARDPSPKVPALPRPEAPRVETAPIGISARRSVVPWMVGFVALAGAVSWLVIRHATERPVAPEVERAAPPPPAAVEPSRAPAVTPVPAPAGEPNPSPVNPPSVASAGGQKPREARIAKPRIFVQPTVAATAAPKARPPVSPAAPPSEIGKNPYR